MGVNPGLGGQEMLPNTLERLQTLKNLHKNFLLSIDGGVGESNIESLKQTGIDMLVSGSFVTMANNFEEQVNKLK